MSILPAPSDDDRNRQATPRSSSESQQSENQNNLLGVRIISDTDAEVFGRGTDAPVRILLSPAVIEIIREGMSTWASNFDPASVLAREYQEWKASTSEFAESFGKAESTCFDNSFCVPDLLFWTLEQFSDSDFPLAETDLIDLPFHTFEEATTVRRFHVRNLSSIVPTDALDFCWYFLVRLLVIDSHLQHQDPTKPTIQRHKELIQNHYSLLISDVVEFHETGDISSASPRADFEARLIDLTILHPWLNSLVAQLIKNWDLLEEDAIRIQEISDKRSECLEEESDDIEVDEYDCDFVTAFKRDVAVMHEIRQLEQLITPESDDDPIWHHPLEYLSKGCCDERRALFIHPAYVSFTNDEFSNAQKFDFLLMERLTSCGYGNWLLPEAEYHLSEIQRWLNDSGDPRSLIDLTKTLQEYLSWPNDRQPPMLRDYFGFPKIAEPLYVTQDIRFWEAVRILKSRSRAEIRIYMTRYESELQSALDWMQASADKRFIVVAGNDIFQNEAFRFGCANRDTSFVLQHRIARSEYDWPHGQINYFRALNYAAFNVGQKKGLGIHQTAALPIKDNRPVLEFFETSGLENSGEDWGNLYGRARVGSMGGYIDAILFTVDDEDDDQDSGLSPSEVDMGLVPIGDCR